MTQPNERSDRSVAPGADRAGEAAAGGFHPPITAQLLFGLKNADPAALTAAEAIRTLLGFGDRLVSVQRRVLYEFVVAFPGGPEPLLESLTRYLDRTATLWNPNKQRGWVRLDGEGEGDEAASFRGGCEVLPGNRRRGADCGAPPLDEDAYDHLLVWSRGQESTPPDLSEGLPGWTVLACGRGELYSLRWADGATPSERESWTEAVAVARTRTQGLLVNPHYQDHRRIAGAVPLPLWGG